MFYFQGKVKSQFPEENMVINKLIKDYLQFNGYNCTCSVFLKGLLCALPVFELLAKFLQ